MFLGNRQLGVEPNLYLRVGSFFQTKPSHLKYAYVLKTRFCSFLREEAVSVL